MKMMVFDKQNICVKRDKSLSYFEMVRPRLANSADAATNEHLCPAVEEGETPYKICGTASNIEYKLCIPEDKECPVQTVEFDGNTKTLIVKKEDGN